MQGSKTKTKIIIIILALGVLLLIRMFEYEWFYDPFYKFFKSDFLSEPLPSYATLKLIMHTVLKYIINSIVSVVILRQLFGAKILRFTYGFYGLGLAVLFLMYGYLLVNLTTGTYLYFYYVRRFLVQPLFLLLLTPAFYYQEIFKKN